MALGDVLGHSLHEIRQLEEIEHLDKLSIR